MYRAHGISRNPKPPKSPKPRRPPVLSERGLPNQKRVNICRFLLLKWSHKDIAAREGCSVHAVKNVENSLKDEGSVRRVPTGILGRPSRINVEDGEALFEHLVQSGWLSQDKIIHWLSMERGVHCSQATVSRYLRQQNWTRKTIQSVSIHRNEDLRESYPTSTLP